MISVAAGDGVLFFESGTNRETIQAIGAFDLVTLDARMLLKHLSLHKGETAHLDTTGTGLIIKTGRFWTVCPGAQKL